MAESGARSHGIAALMALFVVVTFSSLSFIFGSASVQDVVPSVAVEHSAPLPLFFEVSTLKGASVIDIGNQGQELIHVSIPEEWVLQEVKGVQLADVTQDPPLFGFVRTGLPAGAFASFFHQSAVESLLLRHPSDALLTLKLKRMDLDLDTVERDVRVLGKGDWKLW